MTKPTDANLTDDAATDTDAHPRVINPSGSQLRLLRSGLHVITETAVHEAGHVAAYLVSGVPVEFATIAGAESLVASALSGVPDPDTSGLNGFTRARTSPPLTDLFAALAGYAGETVLLDTDDSIDILMDLAEDSGGPSDIIWAMGAAASCYVGPASYDHSSGTLTRLDGTAFPQEVERLLARRAMRLLERAWKRLLQFFAQPEVRLATWEIAGLLIRDGRIEGSVASEIVERTGASRVGHMLDLRFDLGSFFRALSKLAPPPAPPAGGNP